MRAAERLARLGLSAVAVVSSYTTYEEESRAKVRAAGAYGVRRRLEAHAEHLWIRLAVERWERRGYLGARRVLLNYESVRRLVVAKYGAAARCHKLPYTCEAAFLQPSSRTRDDGAGAEPPQIAGLKERGAPLVLAVSRHNPQKGIDILLHALARLRHAGVPLRACLIGGGPLLDEHRRLAARLGLLDGAVALVGAVPDISPFLVRADVYVLPSREEQSGSLALIEALQAGVAVVASGVDGILEDVADGDDALLVPPGDEEALAGALRRVLADPGLRRRLGRRGHETFAARFSPTVVAGGLRELYASLGVEP